LFVSACIIPWYTIIFDVDNDNIPLHIAIQDVFEIIQRNRLLNIAIIQLWMM